MRSERKGQPDLRRNKNRKNTWQKFKKQQFKGQLFQVNKKNKDFEPWPRTKKSQITFLFIEI